MDSILNSNTYSSLTWICTQCWVQIRMCKVCTAHIMQCSASVCAALSLGSKWNITIGQNFFPQESRFVKDFGWLGIRAESWNIFWSETEKREILTFLVAQVSPLCTSFDCTAVSMQQRFDNLGFYTKIYKKFLLQILEAISYFFSSSLVLFASSDSWKKTYVKNLEFSKSPILKGSNFLL